MNIFNIFKKRKIKNLEQLEQHKSNNEVKSLFDLLFSLEGKINNMHFILIDNIHLEINLYIPEYLIDNTTKNIIKNIINKNAWNFSIKNQYIDMLFIIYIEIYPIFANKIVDDLIDYMRHLTLKHTNYLRKLKLKSLEKYQE